MGIDAGPVQTSGMDVSECEGHLSRGSECGLHLFTPLTRSPGSMQGPVPLPGGLRWVIGHPGPVLLPAVSLGSRLLVSSTWKLRNHRTQPGEAALQAPRGPGVGEPPLPSLAAKPWGAGGGRGRPSSGGAWGGSPGGSVTEFLRHRCISE